MDRLLNGWTIGAVVLALSMIVIGVLEIRTRRRILPRLGGATMSPRRWGVSAIFCGAISLTLAASGAVADRSRWPALVPFGLCVAFVIVDQYIARREPVEGER